MTVLFFGIMIYVYQFHFFMATGFFGHKIVVFFSNGNQMVKKFQNSDAFVSFIINGV